MELIARPPPQDFLVNNDPPWQPMSQRRRSSAAHTRPAVPPPNLPIPSVPVPVPPLPDSPEISRRIPQQDDLEDPPPPSILHTRAPTDDPPDPSPNQLTVPDTRESRQEPRIPSSRRALTRALELAREAVQLDSTNEEPQAAVMAYGRSVALLSEVMERVRRGEDSTESRSRRNNGRPRSAVAQEEEVRRLQNIVRPARSHLLHLLTFRYSTIHMQTA